MDYAIIAAGEGSRLQQEGVKQPKPLVQIGGEPLIGRLIRIFLAQGATSVSVIVNEEMTEVREFLETLRPDVPFHVVVKSTPSSMHSFCALAPYLQVGKFCLTTVDTIFREDEFSRYIRAFSEHDGTDGMMGVTSFVDDEKPLYVGTDQDLNITGFYDREESDCRYVSGGIYGLTPAAVGVLRSCMQQGVSRMRNYQRELIRAGLRLRAFPFKKIIDIDHAADIIQAGQFIKEKV